MIALHLLKLLATVAVGSSTFKQKFMPQIYEMVPNITSDINHIYEFKLIN